MIDTEVIVNFSNKKTLVFIDSADFESDFNCSPIHKHEMTEVHIVTCGSGEFIYDGERIQISENQMMIVPKDIYHQRNCYDFGTRVITFQTTAEVKKCRIVHTDKFIIEELKKAVLAYKNGIAGTKIPFYLGLILSDFAKSTEEPITSVQDREFLIHEFFTINYNKDVHLSDIAVVLNLSEKQAERTIKKITGKTFCQLLTDYRINAAKELMTKENYPLSRIAELVGYKSYSGFWKAYNNK
ncbi:MAG: helix-turn-helix domain-containing protein [Clostridia bacterium]|nr:helix-turn-helix domain-containing protein [Clostridia bacterium]